MSIVSYINDRLSKIQGNDQKSDQKITQSIRTIDFTVNHHNPINEKLEILGSNFSLIGFQHDSMNDSIHITGKFAVDELTRIYKEYPCYRSLLDRYSDPSFQGVKIKYILKRIAVDKNSHSNDRNKLSPITKFGKNPDNNCYYETADIESLVCIGEYHYTVLKNASKSKAKRSQPRNHVKNKINSGGSSKITGKINLISKVLKIDGYGEVTLFIKGYIISMVNNKNFEHINLGTIDKKSEKIEWYKITERRFTNVQLKPIELYIMEYCFCTVKLDPDQDLGTFENPSQREIKSRIGRQELISQKPDPEKIKVFKDPLKSKKRNLKRRIKASGNKYLLQFLEREISQKLWIKLIDLCHDKSKEWLSTYKPRLNKKGELY